MGFNVRLKSADMTECECGNWCEDDWYTATENQLYDEAAITNQAADFKDKYVSLSKHSHKFTRKIHISILVSYI